MCKKLLRTIYRLMVAQTGARAAFIEERLELDVHAATLSEDDSRNEREMYAALFSEDCRLHVEGLFLDMLKELKGLPYERSAEVLNGLAILQQLIASALWKHSCAVGPSLESFAREFDRLDRTDERRRLYQHA